MKVTLNRIDENYLFELTNSQGNKILLDNTSLNDAKGVSPMESLLMAIVSCSGIDIVHILKKQRQEIVDFKAEVVAERHEVEEAKPFKKIEIIYTITGNVDLEKAKKAADLSFYKYCSVSMSLNPNIELIWEVIVNP